MAKSKKNRQRTGPAHLPVADQAEPPASQPRDRTVWLLSLLLVALTLISYAPTYVAGYVEFDDQLYVRDNPRVASGLTAENVLWAFREVHYMSNWHPLTWLSHMLDVELFGVEPAGHHVMNVLIHALNAVLLFLMLRSFTGQSVASFFVAALFAVHPLNVESVAWIAQRKNTLSTLFGILAIWAYGRYASTSQWRAYVTSLVMYGLSLMAKPMLVTLPLALLLLDYWPLRRPALQPEANQSTLSFSQLLRGGWKLLPEKLPYLGLTVAVSLVTLTAQESAINPFEKYPLSERLANVSVSYLAYLKLLVWRPIWRSSILCTQPIFLSSSLSGPSCCCCSLPPPVGGWASGEDICWSVGCGIWGRWCLSLGSFTWGHRPTRIGTPTCPCGDCGLPWYGRSAKRCHRSGGIKPGSSNCGRGPGGRRAVGLPDVQAVPSLARQRHAI